MPRLLALDPPKMLHRTVAIGLLAAALGPTGAQAAGVRGAQPPLWQSKTQDGLAVVEWRRDDIRAVQARSPFATLFSAQQSFRKRFSAEDMSGHIEGTWKILSMVGPLLAIEEGEYYFENGMAHPGGRTRWMTADLARRGRPALLTDWFDDRVVLKALGADKLVRKAWLEVDAEAKPATTAELVKVIMKWHEACEYEFDAEMLTRFAFHHLEGKGANRRVAVRLGLSHGCEAARGNLTQVGVLLPVPASLESALGGASSRLRGVLIKDAGALTGGKAARLEMGGPDPGSVL